MRKIIQNLKMHVRKSEENFWNGLPCEGDKAKFYRAVIKACHRCMKIYMILRKVRVISASQIKLAMILED